MIEIGQHPNDNGESSLYDVHDDDVFYNDDGDDDDDDDADDDIDDDEEIADLLRHIMVITDITTKTKEATLGKALLLVLWRFCLAWPLACGTIV